MKRGRRNQKDQYKKVNDLKCYEGFSPLAGEHHGTHNYALNPIVQTLENYEYRNQEYNGD